MASADTVTFRLGHVDAAERHSGIGIESFADAVERLSDGAMRVGVFHVGQLGSIPAPGREPGTGGGTAGARLPHQLLERARLRDRRAADRGMALWEALLKAGALERIVPYGTEATGALRIVALAALAPPRSPEVLHQDDTFRLRLARAAGNDYLADAIRLLGPAMRLTCLATGRGVPLEPMLDEHRAILATIAARDAEAAGSLMQAHLLCAKERILSQL